MERLTPRLPLLFVMAVLAHAAFAVALGQASPAGRYQDVNVYLELAQTLWREHAYVSLVNERPYPPGYPLLLAPTFALGSNELRFAVIYGLHAVLLGLASLMLLPLLGDALGRARAWIALIALQGAAGASFTLLHAQSEALYTPLLVALTGAVYLAFRRDEVRFALLAGLLAGVTLSTRRLGVVAPLALMLVAAHDGLAAFRSGGALPWRRSAALLLGAIVGLGPDLLAAALQGEVVNAYPTYGATYAQAGGAALLSARNALYTASTAANQLAYFVLITLGAPILMAAYLWSRWTTPSPPDDAPSEARRVDRARRRTVQWVGYAALGSAALTTLHIVRHVFKTSASEGFSTYPRYLDPLEIPLLACGLVAGAALAGPATSRAASRLVARFGLLAVALAAASGPWYRTRAGRLPPVRRLAEWGLGPAAPWAFFVVSLAVLAAFWWLWRRGATGRLAGLCAAVALSWTLSLHVPVGWASRGMGVHPAAALLSAPALAADPDSTLCVVVDRRSRRYYELAFRSDHDVRFVPPDRVAACARDHRAAFVIARQRSPWRPSRARIETAGPELEVGPWRAWPVASAPAPAGS